MGVLGDADALTIAVVRSTVSDLNLSVGDIEFARECATGPGVVSPTKVAVSTLQKRGAK